MKYGNKIAALLVLISGVIATNLYHHHIFTAHLTTDALGFLLLYLSFQLLRRKQIAFYLSYGLVTLLAASGLAHHQLNWHVIVYLFTMLALLIYKSNFTAKSQNLSMQRALWASGVVAAIALTYGTVGFYLIEKRAFGIDFSLLQSVKYAFVQLVSLTNVSPVPITRHAHLFLDSLDWISILSLMIAVSNLFKPVRFAVARSAKDMADATAIISSHSQSVEDFFKLWPQDKHYFFNQKRTSVIAYKVARGSALILDGPSGNSRTFKKLLQDFIAFSEHNGWTPGIVHADEHTKHIAQAVGFKAVFIGNEALVDTHAFQTQTTSSKHFRYIENKAKREGLTVAIWQAPLSDAQLQQLKEVSDAWLTTPGRREYTFVMGYFDERYLRSCTVAVLQSGQRILAYANMIPSYTPGQASIDHMRSKPQMPSVGMHFLLKTLIAEAERNGVRTFNLGLSPLAGVDELTDPTIQERLLLVVKRLGGRYYSFGGLEQFKNKFKPDWQPRYMMYLNSPANLITLARSLTNATELPSAAPGLNKKAAVLSFAIGLSYLSFVFAYPLGVHVAGLASVLGASGAPYNWLFNGLDTFCGLAIVAISYIALSTQARYKDRILYLGLLLGGVGNIFAALAPLKQNEAYTTFPSILHIGFSAVSIIGFFVAITLFILQKIPPKITAYSLLAGIAVISLASTLPFSPELTGALQRTQLTIIAVFIAIISYRSLITFPTRGQRAPK